jgi:hypothetical protein
MTDFSVFECQLFKFLFLHPMLRTCGTLLKIHCYYPIVFLTEPLLPPYCLTNLKKKISQPAANYKFPFFISPTACSTALAVNAMYNIDGLWLPVLVIQAPSVTKTFLQ